MRGARCIENQRGWADDVCSAARRPNVWPGGGENETRTVVRMEVNVVLEAAGGQSGNVEVASAHAKLRGAVELPGLKSDHANPRSPSLTARELRTSGRRMDMGSM